MIEKPPADIAEQAEGFGRRYGRDLDGRCAIRMEELGIADRLHGTPDFDRDGRWREFIARDRVGGRITTGITVHSGCLKPNLLKDFPGVRAFTMAHLRDRIDAIIAHEYEKTGAGPTSWR